MDGSNLLDTVAKHDSTKRNDEPNKYLPDLTLESIFVLRSLRLWFTIWHLFILRSNLSNFDDRLVVLFFRSTVFFIGDEVNLSNTLLRLLTHDDIFKYLLSI